MKNSILSFFVLSVLSVSAQQQKITITIPGLYPEGVAYSQQTRSFYIGSVTTGQVGKVDEQGNYSVFYSDTSLKSTYGMKVNEMKKQLWVCVSDANYSKYSDASTKKKLGKIIFLDLVTGNKTGEADLASLYEGEHFANDIVIDNKGTAYITDSFSPVIYKIDAGGKATVFTKSELFGSINVGLNGLVWHPGGYLLVAHNTNGVILKIPLNNPSAVTQVAVNTFFPGADGLLLTDSKELLLVQNKGVNKVFTLASTDDWKSAEIKASTLAADRFQNPTTMAFRNKESWVLNAKLNELNDSTMGTSKEFSLQQAVLQKIK